MHGVRSLEDVADKHYGLKLLRSYFSTWKAEMEYAMQEKNRI